jgi:subtilisin family serine protease
MRLVKSSKRKLNFERLEIRNLMAADFMPNELLVQYRADAAPAFEAMNDNLNAEVLLDLEPVGMDTPRFARILLPMGRELDGAADSYSRIPGVLSTEYNWIVTKTALSNDPSYSDGSHWGVYSDDQPVVYGGHGTTNAFGSGAEIAWGRDLLGSSNIVIGVLDEGIDINHEDLQSNIWVNPGEVPNDGVDNDRNGYIDDINGWDFLNRDRTVYDGSGGDNHGTHVAGTIGALGGNGIGVAGVNWNVKMISAKFLGPNGGNIADAVTAIDYMTKLKVNYGVNLVAINNSWGGGNYSSALHASIIRAANAGILFVAAAGNSYVDNDIYMTYPSSYSTTNGAIGQPAASYESVIAVSAINPDGSFAGYSNWGVSTVDIGAPGTTIVSTLPGNTYGVFSGTSMATPHVTGAIALVASTQPNANAQSLREAILFSAEPTASLTGKTTTGSRLTIPESIDYFSLPTLSIGNAEAIEGSGDGQTNSMIFTVSLSEPLDTAFSVNFATASGTATAQVDFVAASGTLEFAPGETSKAISIDIIGDRLVEANENMFLMLSGMSSRIARYANQQATGTINNDDSTSLVINDVASIESAGTILFTVTLTNPTTSSVSVRFATANGTAKSGRNADYTGVSGSLNFAPGETSKTISVSIRNDTTIESNEIFFLNLSSAVGAGILDVQGIGTIIDDDGGAQIQSASEPSTDLLSAWDWDDLIDDSEEKRRTLR